MPDEWNVQRRATYLAKKIRRLRLHRRQLVTASKGHKRARLTAAKREAVLARTSARCHICGGKVDGKWQADHVLAHAQGGGTEVENFLPAHELCNNYRWHYLPEEFQLALKIGVWAKGQVEKQTFLGNEIARRFVTHERQREARRK